MTTPSANSRRWLLSLDATAVVLFVVIGRNTHGETASIGGVARTAAPFLIALVAGWAMVRAWRGPSSIRTGVAVLATTVIAGMMLRRFVFEDGTALSFILVASAFLTLLLLGWRIAVGWVLRRAATTG